MQLIKKHTTTASQIYIESDGHRVLVNKDELAVVARLWSVCNNCTVAENCKYQTDLYGRAYTPKMRRRKPNTKQTRHALAVHKSDWDEDISRLVVKRDDEKRWCEVGAAVCRV